MRIAIGMVAHETNTFSNVKTTVDLFKLRHWDYGEEIIKKSKGVRDYLGGMIDKGEELGVELIPTFSASAVPSGLITKDTYEILKSELIHSIRSAGPLDAICLSLHGAGVAEGIDDLEGVLLKELRNTFGYLIPIVATLDLHANMTDLMVKEADLLLGVNYYPHTDCYNIGAEAMEAAVKIINRELQPEMYLEKLPILIPTTTTYTHPAKEINYCCWEQERTQSIIDCTFYHGFPYTDIPGLGVSVLAIANRNKNAAKIAAKEVTKKIWDLYDLFFPNILTPELAIVQALNKEGVVVLNETSDNPGAGAPGDGTYLLKALLEINPEKSCFGFVYDPEVAEIAYKTGVGKIIKVSLGGKTDAIHGKPILLEAYVKCITDGIFKISSEMNRGQTICLGKTVRLQAGNVDIIVCSVRDQTFDEQIFLLHGIDIRTYKIIGLKSSHHFRAGFQHIAKEIITVDSPGLSSLDLRRVQYKRITRPILPLDSKLNNQLMD